jgi:PAS domain-containing protein
MTRVPTSEEVAAFLAELRRHRDHLLSFAQAASIDDQEALAATIDAIGEQLLVADEELRVQNEQLERSARRLDLLVAAHEALFEDAPTALLQTDADGLVLRYNRAAARLLDLGDPGERSRTLTGLLVAADRAPVRALVSRLRNLESGAGCVPDLLEVTLLRSDGTPLPALLSGRRSGSGSAPILHWEVRERVPGEAARGMQPASRLHASAAERMHTLARAAVDLASQPGPAQTVEHVVAQARAAVPGCDEAGVMLVRARGRIESPAATAEVAAACDQLQEALGEGPCLGSIEQSSPVRVDDMAREQRWPRFARRAAGLGVGSLLAVPLTTPRGTIGALNLYAARPGAFDDDDELTAVAYATHAAIALANAELESNLRTGLATREEIGRAVGILMERHRITASAAFDMLVVASQHSHRKLRDVAAWMNETGEDVAALIRAKRPRAGD